jgi:LysM repeat protein
VQNRLIRAAVVIAVLGFVAGCEMEPPAATASNAPDVAAPGPDSQNPAPGAKGEARRIVVRSGQSVSRIAAQFGVSKQTIIAANDLTPPYKIKAGQQLLVPSADEPPPAQAAVGLATPEATAVDRSALPGPGAPTATVATASPPPPVIPAVKPIEVAAPATDKTPAPAAPAPTTASIASPSAADLPAPAATAAAAPPGPVQAAAPPGVTCPFGTAGVWSEDIIKKPLYICRKSSSPS